MKILTWSPLQLCKNKTRRGFFAAAGGKKKERKKKSWRPEQVTDARDGGVNQEKRRRRFPHDRLAVIDGVSSRSQATPCCWPHSPTLLLLSVTCAAVQLQRSFKPTAAAALRPTAAIPTQKCRLLLSRKSSFQSAQQYADTYPRDAVGYSISIIFFFYFALALSFYSRSSIVSPRFKKKKIFNVGFLTPTLMSRELDLG